MKRINIYDENHIFDGWFNHESATEIASYDDKHKGGPYINGKVLLATTNGKLVVNSWNNTGHDVYRFADNEAEIAEILSAGGYAGNDKKLKEILDKYEI